jgi:hypothetical protein
MATQRVTVAKVAGAAGAAVADRFRAWRAARQGDTFPPAIRAEVDRFALSLRAHAASPPVVYFSEWIDHWSMGDVVPALGQPGAEVVAGDRFEACCHRPPVTVHAPTWGGEPVQEAEWLAARVREAGDAWSRIAPEGVLVVLREVIGATVTDDALVAALTSAPAWTVAE